MGCNICENMCSNCALRRLNHSLYRFWPNFYPDWNFTNIPETFVWEDNSIAKKGMRRDRHIPFYKVTRRRSYSAVSSFLQSVQS